jgi:diguanylate cyclase (GGDEF)-like protein
MVEATVADIQNSDPLRDIPTESAFNSPRIRRLVTDEAVLLERVSQLKETASRLALTIPERYKENNDFWASAAGELPRISAELQDAIPDEEILSKKALQLALFSAENAQQAEDEATIDDLTKAKTRRVLDEEVTHLIEHQRQDSHTGILFIDIDNFKQFNTDYGHTGGDQALVALVRQLQQYVRPTDIVGRYGGEEFVIVLSDLPNTMIASAKAEQIREAIAKNTSLLQLHGEDKGLTVSIGVTTIKPTDTVVKDAWDRGSDHMNRAKKDEGKNTVLDDFGPIDTITYSENPETKKLRIDKVSYRP